MPWIEPFLLAGMGLREEQQLLSVARKYVKLGNRCLGRLNSTRTLAQITQHAGKRLSRAELALAHFASASVRLGTIQERREADAKSCGGLKNYQKDFYKGALRKDGEAFPSIKCRIDKDRASYLPRMLRDNIAHRENDETDYARDRFQLLQETTLRDVGRALTAAVDVLSKALT